ncbi:TetR/AcrR family transcriptional regulator [Marinicellulosiphila megalodicopiae]|uniref:TetR/AcrR family transcriptional regulator n=1 Tax=Marinicellulosiphila megalodicopiae TaxID=2724896 RepID=UPI003BAE1550
MSRDNQKQQTRELILNTASELFIEHGYENTSTRMIAKQANIGVGTVFSHFKDKQLLTQALFHKKIDDKLSRHLEKANNESTGLGYFLSFAKFLYGFYEEDRAFSKALMQTALFDVTYFEKQMNGFILQISDKLKIDLPKHTQQQRQIMAKAWFGFYTFHLLAGLSQPDLKSTQWLQALRKDCEILLSCH